MQKDLITLNEIKKSLKSKGFGVILLIFSIPIAIPLPYPPGFTTILGMPLLMFSLQFYLHQPAPWLPAFIAKKSFERHKLASVLEKIAPYVRKFEKLSRPRFWVFCPNTIPYKVIGIFMILNSVCVILPIIFGNAIPALGTALISMGLIRRDGAFVVLGMIASIIGWAVASAVVIIGAEFIKSIFG
ncbi:MAG: hypothetical protein BGO27_03900 [Alphaproteobacteria bacterium 33-17]|nr:MAG: hypothetical protein BGO27_03900 [Alphaproteobacteria bacterium 33-17]